MGSKHCKQYKKREFTKLLRDNGGKFVRNGKGSHEVWECRGQEVIVQLNPNMMQCKRIIKELGIISK